jgi:hypothetical protein
MTALLVPTVSASAVILAAVAGPFVGGLMQHRSSDRLRAAAAANFELIGQLGERDADRWSDEISEADRLLERQLARTFSRDQAELDKRREWNNLGVVAFLMVICGPLLWLLYDLDRWWSWALYWPLLVLLLGLTAAGVERTFNSPEPQPEDPEPSTPTGAPVS